VAESKENRTKASKLHRRVKDGKKLTPEQKRWLDAYDVRTAKAKGRVQLFKTVTYEHLEAKPRWSDPANQMNLPAVKVHALPPPSSAVTVHETEHLTDRLDAAALTWRPTVPPPPEDAEPTPPGAPPPPTVGAPIVDAAPDPAATAAGATAGSGTGSPAMAVKVAGIVVLITRAGIKATLELLEDAPLPDELRELMHDPEAQQQTLQEVGAAAYRMSIDAGWQDIPGGDKATVIGACLGSFGAIYANHRRKKKQKAENGTTAAPSSSSARSAAPQPAARPTPPQADVPPELAGIWGDS
jgi:hypothetical protein